MVVLEIRAHKQKIEFVTLELYRYYNIDIEMFILTLRQTKYANMVKLMF